MILNSSETSGPLSNGRVLKTCSLEVYIKSCFGEQKGGSLEPPRTPPAYGPDKYYGAIDTNNGTESLNKALKHSFLPWKKNMTLTSTTYLRITGNCSSIMLLLTQCLITLEEVLVL